MAKRIVLLTQWFDPEPTFKGIIFARKLIEQGYEVEVITGFPNYPGGKVYPGYKISLLQRESIQDIEVTRVALYPSHDGSAIKRVFNYISFAITSAFYGIFMMKKADVMYVYHPPLTTGVSAAVIRFFRKIPVVYDVQDMWPDTLRATGMVNNETVLGIVSNICQGVYKNVDKIAVLSPGFKDLLVERGIPASKIQLIYNWCDESALAVPEGVLPENFPSSDKFTILFAGTMGKAQALDAVVAAAAIVQNLNRNINFVFVGGGVEVAHLQELVAVKNLDNVVFIPRVPMSQVGAMLQKADALLVHLRKDPLFEITLPSKIQAYMSTAKPILVAVAGNATSIIAEAQCGLVAEPENPQSIADAAILLANMSATDLAAMGKAGRGFYDAKMSIDVGVASFIKLFDESSLC
jgi:colanic acid biosynthesis glycosyl transferase WcaI